MVRICRPLNASRVSSFTLEVVRRVSGVLQVAQDLHVLLFVLGGNGLQELAVIAVQHLVNGVAVILSEDHGQIEHGHGGHEGDGGSGLQHHIVQGAVQHLLLDVMSPPISLLG